MIRPVAQAREQLLNCLQRRANRDKSTWKFVYWNTNGVVIKYWLENVNLKTKYGKTCNLHVNHDWTKLDSGDPNINNDFPVWALDDSCNNGKLIILTGKYKCQYRPRASRVRTVGKYNNKLEFTGGFYKRVSKDTPWIIM